MSAEVPQAASAEEQKEMEDKVISPEKGEEAKVKKSDYEIIHVKFQILVISSWFLLDWLQESYS